MGFQLHQNPNEIQKTVHKNQHKHIKGGDWKFTFKKRIGRSPLLLACGTKRTSLTFVRKANLPSLLQANQVPPAKPSRPPKISPPSHHASGSVGLPNCKNKTPPNGNYFISIFDITQKPNRIHFQCKSNKTKNKIK